MKKLLNLLTEKFSKKWIDSKDREVFKTDGYMIIKGVVPKKLVHLACQEISEVIGADLNDQSTWYGGELVNDGLVPFHHLQSVWNIRQNQNVYKAFSEFWFGEKKSCMQTSIDLVSDHPAI